MQSKRFWITFGCLGLLATAGESHEISYEGKICRCIGDVDGSGEVDIADIHLVLDCFHGECSELDEGQEEGECSARDGCAPDVNENGQVGDGDLRMILGNLGPCRKEGDVNDDRVVDFRDMEAVWANLGLDCRQDIDHSGWVTDNDAALSMHLWGPSDDRDFSADLDGDGSISILDVISVLDAVDRDCRGDVNYDGLVDMRDFCDVCRYAPHEDCPEAYCPARPDGSY